MVFFAGDRVVCTINRTDRNKDILAGDTGTVLLDNDGNSAIWVSVRWDKESSRNHNCDGLCEYGHGWKVPNKCLRLEKEDFAPDASEVDDFLRDVGCGL